MGLIGPLLFSLDLAKLKALLPTLTDEKQIAECKARIAELEAEENE